LKITIDDIEKTGKVLDGISFSSYFEVNGISFGLSDKEEAKNEAIKVATKNAKARAGIIADSLDKKIDGIKFVSIRESEPVNYYGGMYKTEAAYDANTPVSAGDVKVKVIVDAQFSIK
jgi:uncharacterized protein